MIWGIVVAAAVVLAIAGVAKMAKPAAAVDAIRIAGLPASTATVTLLGVGELVLGVVVALWQPLWAAALLGVAYLVFAGFSLRLSLVRGGAVSCGCFGQRDAPIGVEHVVVNLLVVGVVVAAVASGGARTIDPSAALGSIALLLGFLALMPGLRASRR